jgi:hypothetical protein
MMSLYTTASPCTSTYALCFKNLAAYELFFQTLPESGRVSTFTDDWNLRLTETYSLEKIKFQGSTVGVWGQPVIPKK